MNEIQKEDKKGVFLIIMFVVYGLLYISRLLSIVFASSFTSVYENGPSWIYGFNIAIFILGVIALVGIFIWKKWGAYLLTVVTIVPVIIDFTVYTEHPTIAQASITLGLLVLFLIAIKMKWNNFK